MGIFLYTGNEEISLKEILKNKYNNVLTVWERWYYEIN